MKKAQEGEVVTERKETLTVKKGNPIVVILTIVFLIVMLCGLCTFCTSLPFLFG